MALRDPVQERAVSTYATRLLSGVSRSAVLKAFPTRAVKRIDLASFRTAHLEAPERLVEELVRPEGCYRLVFERFRQSDERGAQSQALFSNLRTKLAREAQAGHRETGLWMLWLAYPLLYIPHPARDSDDYLLAPLFLWPIRIESASLSEGELLLKRESGSPRFNRIAWQWIRRNLEFDPPEPTGTELLQLGDFDALRKLVQRSCAGFRPTLDASLGPRIDPVPDRPSLRSLEKPRLLDAGIVGLIQWENMELLADLEKLHSLETLPDPAGDILRQRERPPAATLEYPKERDRYLVTDTDQSQERAVWMARREEGVVIHGPPGTGKSQVIVNIVADALAHGETVLVVCQKKAALDVVASRLRRADVGLGDLFLQVDDAESDRRRIVEMLRDQQPLGNVGDNQDRITIAEEIELLEKQFEDYAKALFQIRDRHGISYRTMLARIIRIERESVGARPLERLRELLKDSNERDLSRLGAALNRIEDLFWEADVEANPWVRGHNHLSGDRYELEQINADLDNALRAAEILDVWAHRGGAASGRLVGNLSVLLDSVKRLSNAWPALDPRIITGGKTAGGAISDIVDVTYGNLACAVDRMIKSQRSILRWISPEFYRDRRAIRSFVAQREWARSMPPDSAFGDIALRVRDAEKCELTLKPVERWLKESESNVLVEDFRSARTICSRLRSLKEYLPKLPILLRYEVTLEGLDERGRRVVSEFQGSPDGPQENWAKVAELSAVLAWVTEAVNESPILRRLTPDSYESERERLCGLARRKRSLEPQSIRDLWASRWSEVDHRWRRALQFRGPRSQRLREIIETGHTRGLFTLRPCWLANPGTVSQIFPLEHGLFDVVIFDEASQCPPEYALATLFRGRRAIVAGDTKQLPPTMFFKTAFDFDASEQDEKEGEDLRNQTDLQTATGAEDLLSLAQTRLPDAHLNVHYRSLDPVLIAFSNAAFYQNRLEGPQPPRPVTPDGTPALFVERVDGVYQRNRTNPQEARHVVEYLRKLWLGFEIRPTVGVITFNEAQADAIEDLLDETVARDPEFRAVYDRELTRTDDGQDVGFFVKSLEAVQGDERDIILFSTTYGRRDDGSFLKSFLGPLNQQGGERRLNVAVTRARQWIRIFTSLPIHNLANALSPSVVETRDAAGRAALQLYLAYAELISTGEGVAAQEVLQRSLEFFGALGEHPGATGVEDSEFEAEVREALRDALGLDIDAQVGSGSFRIDLAVRAPSGGYILGIECDGKAYHSAPSARAYDYWRQIVLEDRGWQIHRVWSTSWWHDRDREIRKVRQRIEGLL